MYCARSRSRNGSSAISDRSSASTSQWRPAARSASIASSAACSRKSSSRRIAALANGSSATSASGLPRHNASAARASPFGAPSACSAASTSRSNRTASTRSTAQPELVAATAREDLRHAPAQQLAQLGHVQLHHLGRRRRRALAPQSLTQPIGRHGLVDLQREHRQHGALLWRPERYRPAVKARLDRPEETNVHVRPSETTLLPRARRINPPIDRTYTGVGNRAERPHPASERPKCPAPSDRRRPQRRVSSVLLRSWPRSQRSSP